MMKQKRAIFYPLIPFFLFILLSEWFSRKNWVPAFLFPAPSRILAAIHEDPAGFKMAFWETFSNSGLGLLLSVSLGLGFALLMSAFKSVRLMFYPYATFFQTVPIIAIAPILVIWFGYGNATVIASAFIVSVFPMIANSVLGLTRTDPTLLNLFSVLGASDRQVLLHLRFPYALPQILGGVKISAGLSVIGAIVGEFISGSGLGGLVDAARNQQRVDRVFAAVLLAALLGMLLFTAISFLNQLLLRYWYQDQR
jgi:NitT/TauT family transport system permease protein